MNTERFLDGIQIKTRMIKDATGVDLITATGTEINSLKGVEI